MNRLLTDHLGRNLAVSTAPQRIISLCPSQTETLWDLGLGSRIVGRTHWCIHPDALREVPVVGGTKNPDLDKIRALQPDLILCEKEENVREHVEAMAAEWPVYVTDVRDLPGCVRMIRDVGALCGVPGAGETLAAETGMALARIPRLHRPVRVLYLIWRKPWMAAGKDTFIDAVLAACGFENAARELQGRYPVLETDDFRRLAPTHILLSSEPFPFGPKHITELAGFTGGTPALLVDGEVFSWYGSRMRLAPAALEALLRTIPG